MIITLCGSIHLLLVVGQKEKKVGSPYYTGNDRLLWLRSQDRPARLPTPLMPEQMAPYLNLLKGKIGTLASHYKMAHKV